MTMSWQGSSSHRPSRGPKPATARSVYLLKRLPCTHAVWRAGCRSAGQRPAGMALACPWCQTGAGWPVRAGSGGWRSGCAGMAQHSPGRLRPGSEVMQPPPGGRTSMMCMLHSCHSPYRVLTKDRTCTNMPGPQPCTARCGQQGGERPGAAVHTLCTVPCHASGRQAHMWAGARSSYPAQLSQSDCVTPESAHARHDAPKARLAAAGQLDLAGPGVHVSAGRCAHQVDQRVGQAQHTGAHLQAASAVGARSRELACDTARPCCSKRTMAVMLCCGGRHAQASVAGGESGLQQRQARQACSPP